MTSIEKGNGLQLQRPCRACAIGREALGILSMHKPNPHYVHTQVTYH